MNGFNITFETVTPESAEVGEVAKSGLLYAGLTLREAHSALRFEGHAVDADCWPTDGSNIRWLIFPTRRDILSGSETSETLHIPALVSPSSRRRIARLFGLLS